MIYDIFIVNKGSFYMHISENIHSGAEVALLIIMGDRFLKENR